MHASAQSSLIVDRGGCHGRRVRFGVDAPASPGMRECNGIDHNDRDTAAAAVAHLFES